MSGSVTRHFRSIDGERHRLVRGEAALAGGDERNRGYVRFRQRNLTPDQILPRRTVRLGSHPRSLVPARPSLSSRSPGQHSANHVGGR
jgi:hypothetical protein